MNVILSWLVIFYIRGKLRFIFGLMEFRVLVWGGLYLFFRVWVFSVAWVGFVLGWFLGGVGLSCCLGWLL